MFLIFIMNMHLHQNFIRLLDSHVYNTRGGIYNFTASSIKGCESESFYYNAILDWNNLPTRQYKINQQQRNIQTIGKKTSFDCWSVSRNRHFNYF